MKIVEYFFCTVVVLVVLVLVFSLGSSTNTSEIYRTKIIKGESAKIELQSLKGGDALEVEERIKEIQFNIEEDKKILDDHNNISTAIILIMIIACVGAIVAVMVFKLVLRSY